MTLNSVHHLVDLAEKDIEEEIQSIGKLASKASEQAYYKWNSTWTRSVQDVVRFKSTYRLD